MTSEIRVPNPKVLGEALFEYVRDVVCRSDPECIKRYRPFDRALFYVKRAWEMTTGEQLPVNWLPHAKALINELNKDGKKGWDEFEKAYKEAYAEWKKGLGSSRPADSPHS